MKFLIRSTAAKALCFVILFAGLSQAATKAKVHVAVYSSGFSIDAERRVVISHPAKRTDLKTTVKGWASGEVPATSTIIDRLDRGVQIHLDSQAKTYSVAPLVSG